MEATQIIDAALVVMAEHDCNFELAVAIADEPQPPQKLWDNEDSGPG